MNRRELRNLATGVIAVIVALLALDFLGRVVADEWALKDVLPDHVHTYSISGWAVDEDGIALPGVEVYDDQNHSTTTDSYGNYTFSGLSAGTYRLWASKGGYKFSPAPREVIVPPDRVAQSFVGTPKHPVIVIPGTGGSANWPCFLYEWECPISSSWDWAPTADKYYVELLDHLRAAGYTEGNEHLNIFFYDWRRPPAENAGRLQERINQVKLITGSPTVDLVAHSQGGLVARAYIQGTTYANDVAHLITLGTPHRGIPYLYAAWEGGEYYGITWDAAIGLAIITRRWITPSVVPNVFSVRAILPSFQAMLPTFDYLYDENHGDSVKPEAGMKQRNNYLPGLNANLATLLNRTDVSTFAGTGVSTPLRFYVHDWRWNDPYTWWPNWDDGTPNWWREPQFRGDGDSTVPTFSAKLTGAHVIEFAGVDHGQLPNSPAVSHAVLTTLGIPHPSMPALVAAPDAAAESVIVMVMDGPAQATVTDSLNRTVGPGGVSIPGAEYISSPGDPFKLILIPAPVEGSYGVSVEGYGSGIYELGLLDTFGPPPLRVSDLGSEWDSPRSQIEPGASVDFTLTYTAGASDPIPLIAETPMISVPLWEAASKVSGRATPGQQVEIFDADSHALLGTATVDADGHFEVGVAPRLAYMQRIYPLSGGVAGIPVTVESRATYLPAVYRNQ